MIEQILRWRGGRARKIVVEAGRGPRVLRIEDPEDVKA